MTTAPPDPDALYAHASFVRGVARAALGGDPEVEDVVQETWLAALRAGPDRPGTLRAWLGGVARRQAAQALRKRVRERRRREEAVRRTPPSTHAEASVADVLARAEIGRRLIEAVLGLPHAYRSVLLLRYYDDLKPREVAARLDLPVETVRTRTRRGLEHLRERLEQKGLGDDADWRASLLVLLVPSPNGVSLAVGTALGALAVKKILALAALVLVLLAGAALVWRPWETAPPSQEETGDRPLRAQDGSGTPPSLVGRADATATTGEERRLPPPVEWATIDRERDLHGVVTARATGVPVGGASIALFIRPWARNGSLDNRYEERVERATARTAADGSWRVRLEPGAAFELEVRADGYAAVLVERAQAGERVDLALERGVALAVTTVDADGRLLEGTRVRIWSVRAYAPAGRGMPMVRGVTDAEGRFTAAGLPSGLAVMVAADHPVHGAAMWREARTPTTGTESIEIEIPRGRTLEGRVTDATTGAPVAGARVGHGWFADDPVPTDADGRYTLPGWTAQGVYEISVRATGYAQEEVVVGDRTRIDVALAPEDAIRGRVVDGSGRPVAGTLVAAVGSSYDSGPQRTSAGSAIAGDDGRFRIGELRHDLPHTLVLTKPGHGRTLYDVYPPPEAGGTVDAGDLPLHDAGTIRGVAQDAAGRPVARARVMLEGANADRARFADGRPALAHRYGTDEERVTDDLGRFAFVDLAPGAYHLELTLPGGRRMVREVELAAGVVVARADFDVVDGRPFVVRVEDEQGRGVDQVMVYVRLDGGGTATGRTGADGRAALTVDREPVTVGVLPLPRYADVRYLDPDEQEVPAGASELRLVLVSAETIRGRVVDETDTPLAAVTLRALRDGETVANSWTGKDGAFELEVPAGSVVDVELEGSRLEQAGVGWIAREAFLAGGVEAVTAGTHDVVIRATTVPSDGTLTVLVTDPRGRPLADAYVYVNGRGDRSVTVERTGADGKAALDHLPRTELEVLAARAPRAEGEDWVLPARVHVVPDGQTVTLAYRHGAWVRGVVVGADGEPATDCTVAARYGESEYTARPDERGRFEARVAADAREVAVRAFRSDGTDAASEEIVVAPGAEGVHLVLP